MYLSGIYTLVCQPVPCVAPPPPSPDPGSTSAFLPAFPSPSQSPFPRSSTNADPTILSSYSSFLFPLSSIFVHPRLRTLSGSSASNAESFSKVVHVSGRVLRLRGHVHRHLYGKRNAVIAGPTFPFLASCPTCHTQPSSYPPQVLS